MSFMFLWVGLWRKKEKVKCRSHFSSNLKWHLLKSDLLVNICISEWIARKCHKRNGHFHRSWQLSFQWLYHFVAFEAAGGPASVALFHVSCPTWSCYFTHSTLRMDSMRLKLKCDIFVKYDMLIRPSLTWTFGKGLTYQSLWVRMAELVRDLPLGGTVK